MRFEIWPPRRKPALIPHELLCKRVSQGGISKAPTNCPTSIISATVTALRGYSVPRAKIIHCCQLGPEAARRHRYVHEVRKILLDLFGGPTGSMAVHVFGLIKKRDSVIDVNQMNAGPSYAPPFISMMARSRTSAINHRCRSSTRHLQPRMEPQATGQCDFKREL